MILKEFSKYLHCFNADIPATVLLSKWLREKLSSPPKKNTDKIIQKEVALLKNRSGFFLMFGRSNSGRKLLESLQEYALSYDNHKFSKWVHKLKASDFN